MNKIYIKRITIKDFKGVKDLSINFSDTVTNIRGDNALGKTSIFDAFTWLLFDKDSKDRTKFDIKPLDKKNNVIKGLTPMVEGIFNVNGKALKLTKTYKEKWVKERGKLDRTFKGNESLYEINDVPVKKKDYIEKVNEIFDEEKFKLLSNPFFFSDNLNWKDARDIILSMVNTVTVEDIIKEEPRLNEIKEELKDEDVEELLKSKKATISKISKQKREIPIRINEVKNSYVDIDEGKINEEIWDLEIKLKDINEKINEEKEKENNSARANQSILDKINSLTIQKKGIENEILQDFYKKQNELKQCLYKLNSDKKDIEYQIELSNKDKEKYDKCIKDNENCIKNLRSKYMQISSQKPNLKEIDLICPTCGRAFEDTDIRANKEELVKNFNEDKASKLEKISREGKIKAEEIAKFINAEKTLDTKMETLLLKKTSIENEIPKNKFSLEKLKVEDLYSKKDKEILAKIENEKSSLEKQIGPVYNSDSEQLELEKTNIEKEILDLKIQLKDIDRNKKLDARVEELLEEEKNVGIELVALEKQVMLYELFITTKIKLLESSINSKFKNVEFKMFKEQVNGCIEETCEALIKGVPFSMTNHSSQINAGIDIINTLSDYYNVQVPTFIDNAEASNKVISKKGQLIKLIVSKDKKIIVEGE